MTDLTHAPKRIYLQHDVEDEGHAFPRDWNGDEVTWCQDRIADSDVEYVRVSDLGAARRGADALVTRLDDWGRRFPRDTLPPEAAAMIRMLSAQLAEQQTELLHRQHTSDCLRVQQAETERLSAALAEAQRERIPREPTMGMLSHGAAAHTMNGHSMPSVRHEASLIWRAMYDAAIAGGRGK